MSYEKKKSVNPETDTEFQVCCREDLLFLAAQLFPCLLSDFSGASAY